MAAPANVYSEKTFEIHNVGVVKYDNLIALKLLEYGVNIKSLFYLDVLFMVGNEGFIGAIEDNPNSLNTQMHSTSRYGKGRLKRDTDGKVFVILNDAGLNTKGTALWIANISLVFNNVIVETTYNAAYYVNSYAYGLRYRWRNQENTDWGVWTSIDVQPTYGIINAKTSNTVNINVPSSGSPNRSIQIQPFQTNSEGTYYSDMVVLELELVSVILENNSVWTNNPATWYIDTSTIEPKTEGGQTQLFTNANKTGQILYSIPRLWEDSRFYYTFGYDVESDKYIFLSRVDSQETPTSWNYAAYSDISQVDADNQVISGTGTPGTLYLNGGDNTWHSSWNAGIFGPIATDGYYAQGDISGVTDTKHLINGIEQ